MNVLFEQGYMINLRSSPIHIVMNPVRSVKTFVVSFLLMTSWETRNLNALFPEPNGLISEPATMFRVIDWDLLATSRTERICFDLR